jgi:hypothetical protein
MSGSLGDNSKHHLELNSKDVCRTRAVYGFPQSRSSFCKHPIRLQDSHLNPRRTPFASADHGASRTIAQYSLSCSRSAFVFLCNKLTFPVLQVYTPILYSNLHCICTTSCTPHCCVTLRMLVSFAHLGSITIVKMQVVTSLNLTRDGENLWRIRRLQRSLTFTNYV